MSLWTWASIVVRTSSDNGASAPTVATSVVMQRRTALPGALLVICCQSLTAPSGSRQTAVCRPPVVGRITCMAQFPPASVQITASSPVSNCPFTW
jgi:hypothetical protein